MDNLSECITDCIGKGVLYYTDLPHAGTSLGKKRRSAELAKDA